MLITALLAISSAVMAALLGYPVGNWLASLKRFKSLISSVLLLPFLLPAFLVGLTILPLQPTELSFGSAFGWILFAHLLMNVGFIARVVAASAVPKEQLEAAAAGAAPHTIDGGGLQCGAAAAAAAARDTSLMC